MPWLEPERVLRQGGHQVGEDGPTPDQEAAVRFAEETIDGYTGLVWGRAVAFRNTVQLTIRSRYLPVPRDVTAIDAVTPYMGVYAVTRDGLELSPGVMWPPMTYVVTGVRGSLTIPEAVTRAGALLAAYHLELADADRSQYDSISQGGFAGTRSRNAFPVPEAEKLLLPYRTRVRS